MTRANRYSPEVRERAVRMLHEQEPSYASRWAALTSIAGKIGCTPETIRKKIRMGLVETFKARKTAQDAIHLSPDEYDKAEITAQIEKEMLEAAQNMDF